MAEIRLDGEDAVVRLAPLEKLVAWRGDVRVPRSAIQAARVVTRPFSELRGLRAPGLAVPGVVALGTLRRRGHKDFTAIYRRRSGVVVELDPGRAPFERLIVSVTEPEETCGLLTDC